jgi:transcriptional antiterminator NusG
MSIAKWYAVHVFTQHEQKVKTLIEKLAKKQNLDDKIQEVIIPVDKEVKVKNGKKTEMETKIFPGYILVKMIMNDTTWNLVKRTEYVTNFVCSSGKPVSIKDSEVKRILESLDPNRGLKPKKAWAKDMVIRVNDGPFIDLTGKIDVVDDEKQRLKVMINLFGRETPVELTYDQVEKI